MSKRILSLVLALVMVLGTFGTVFAAETGNDKIDWLVEQGIVKGNASGDLMLDKTIDRASVAKMVVEALGLQTAATGMQGIKTAFPDVPVAHWSNGNINIVAGKGLMKGNAKGQFMPSATISYAEVVTILVRMMDGFTAEEEKTAVWPASYIAKANELGILEDISVTDYSAAAIRKDILEMFYNAMINLEVGKYSVVKGIVLENYRVQKLDKDKVLVEVLREIKKADYVEQSRKEQGEQITLTIPAKVGDVENLLGKVADFTVDKNNNVVAMKIDESYKVETGAFKATKNKIGSYTVDLPERYNKNDETIFRTYYNNEAYAYEDFYKNPDEKERKDEFTVDYARVTVKNGKALFIDAFNFEDIAPVKEVKKDGEEVLVYNDIRDGAIKTIEIKSSTKIVTFNNGAMGVGSKEDIKANDVVHQFKGGLIVRKDAAVNGKFEKVSDNRDKETFVHVDGKEYEILDKDYKRAVYSYDSGDFFTLLANRADTALREFRGEEVTLLLDLAGNAQYIGSKIELGEFVALVTRVSGNDVRVLKTDGKTYDYKANLDTKYNDKTGHRNLNYLEVGSLVYMSVDGDIIEELQDLTSATAKGVTELTSRDIKLSNEDTLRILDKTNIFVSMPGKDLSVRKAADVADAFKKDSTDVRAYVINGKEFEKLTRRPEANITRETEAHTIVFTKINIKSDYDTKVVQFDGFADRQDRQMRVILADGTPETRYIDRDIQLPKGLEAGDILEIEQTKDDKKDIKKVTTLITKAKDKNVFKVHTFDYTRNLVLEDKNGERSIEYYVDSKTAVFGGRVESADRLSYVLEKDANGKETRYVKAILVRDRRDDVTGVFGADKVVGDGVVTKIRQNISADTTHIEVTKGTTAKEYEVRGLTRAFVDTLVKEGDEVKVILDSRDNLVGFSYIKLSSNRNITDALTVPSAWEGFVLDGNSYEIANTKAFTVEAKAKIENVEFTGDVKVSNNVEFKNSELNKVVVDARNVTVKLTNTDIDTLTTDKTGVKVEKDADSAIRVAEGVELVNADLQVSVTGATYKDKVVTIGFEVNTPGLNNTNSPVDGIEIDDVTVKVEYARTTAKQYEAKLERKAAGVYEYSFTADGKDLEFMKDNNITVTVKVNEVTRDKLSGEHKATIVLK